MVIRPSKRDERTTAPRPWHQNVTKVRASIGSIASMLAYWQSTGIVCDLLRFAEIGRLTVHKPGRVRNLLLQEAPSSSSKFDTKTRDTSSG